MVSNVPKFEIYFALKWEDPHIDIHVTPAQPFRFKLKFNIFVYCVCNFVRKVNINLVVIAEIGLIHMLNIVLY